jgi:hypothetical protein
MCLLACVRAVYAYILVGDDYMDMAHALLS